MASVRVPTAFGPKADTPVSGLPCLLEGEIIVASSERILKFNTMSKTGSGVMGSLHITNFKLAFTTMKLGQSNSSLSRKASFSTKKAEDLIIAGPHFVDDFIPLTCIQRLTVISTSKNKTKILTGNKVPSSKYDILEIVCKDFRVIQFNISLCTEGRKSFMSALVHYAFPHSVERLFAFQHSKIKVEASTDSSKRAFYTFRHPKDYELLLTSQMAQQKWHVSKFNKDFSISKTLPELNVFPSEIADEELAMLALFYEDGRLPTWEWTDTTHGVSLLTSGSLKPSRSSFYSSTNEKISGHPNLIFTSIQNACEGLDKIPDVEVVHVSSYLPTIQELQQGFVSLCKPCCCHSVQDFWSLDETWFSRIESSRWIEYIQSALKCTLDVAKFITEESKPVILEEPGGRDYTCLVSSLVQVLLDPFFRTNIGLQSLIQKSWVTKGHKFLDRVAHLHSKVSKKFKPVKEEIDTSLLKDAEENEEESPVFLLFINCLRDLIMQNPLYFEYNEQFLLMLLDSVYSCIFETFLFNSEHQRSQHLKNKTLKSLWDFLSNDVPPIIFEKTFVNPLCKISALEHEFKSLQEQTFLNKVKKNHVSKGKISNSINRKSLKRSVCDTSGIVDELVFEKAHIIPEISIIHHDFWQGYFLRWLPSTDVGDENSGELSLLTQQKKMVEEIAYLEDRLLKLFTVQKSDVGTAKDYHQKSLSWRKRKKVNRNGVDTDQACSSTNFSFHRMVHDLTL